jgi:hypothetical protein
MFSTDSTAMCAQTIFSALDFLTAWIIDIKKTAVVRKSKGILQKGMLYPAAFITMSCPV